MSLQPDLSRMKRDLAALVGVNTENPPGRELEAAQLVHRLLAAEGFDLSLSEYKPGRANVMARMENGPGPTFAFNTHLDVVPAGNGWRSDPFILREADNRLYARGACDAKGPLAAMIEAMRMLAANRGRWSGTLLGVFTADEEIASEGAKHYAAGGPHVDFVVVGEPTSNATFSAHKGSLRPLVRVHGVTAHSGTPHLGENAIYRAAQLLSLIEGHHNDVVRCRCHPLVGAASLTVTRVQGGHADNVIPGACDLLLDRRMVPGERDEDVKREFDQLLALAYERFGVRAEIVEYRATTGSATETARDEKIVQTSLEACRANGTFDPGPFGFQGGCDLVHFRSVGATGVVIGPGTLAVAHKPDEFVPIDEFLAASLIYRDVALDMLRTGA
ncbi:M20 family metallopeptidase [Robbsia sp. Bb-Pol-6]|uniref:M20 family metallopeptidase n=1 Tax=Robbsia betulipollinis TaxID=2981849 RepID=A0ABT3ZI18_9BURK|nr:M20 family metallopeptidase [Robbsia betulipollinis]MCY0386168.1 M20 family metallopeptidase [Robbsia betulipollinis]